MCSWVHLRSRWLLGKGTGREVTSHRGCREGDWKQRPAGTEEPQGGDTSAKGAEENGGALINEPSSEVWLPCPGALWT